MIDEPMLFRNWVCKALYVISPNGSYIFMSLVTYG